MSVITKPGKYKQHDGDAATVLGKHNGWWYGVDASSRARRWLDDGTQQQCQCGYFETDIIGEFCEPACEWTPTCELRDRDIGEVYFADRHCIPEGSTTRFVNGKWHYVVREQKWVCGDKSEWRAIGVQQ